MNPSQQLIADAMHEACRRNNGKFVVTSAGATALALVFYKYLREQIGGFPVYITSAPSSTPEGWDCQSSQQGLPGAACALSNELKGEIESLKQRMDAMESWLPASTITKEQVAQIKRLSWVCLDCLGVSRPNQMTLSDLLDWAQAEDPDSNLREIRLVVNFLAIGGLVTLTEGTPTTSTHEQQRVALTKLGIDVVEYTVDCPAGIDRPAKQEAPAWYRAPTP